MTNESRWPTQGPASYFPSIEKTYGQSIEHWLEVIDTAPVSKHMEVVEHLKTEHGLGHGHANALVAWHKQQGCVGSDRSEGRLIVQSRPHFPANGHRQRSAGASLRNSISNRRFRPTKH